jgi:hypothetical protein
MSNWFYNEVEMMDKHKMLKGAGGKYRPSGAGNGYGKPALPRRFMVLFGRFLVGAGKSVLKRFESVPDKAIVPQVGEVK